jgi:hypothetical protein
MNMKKLSLILGVMLLSCGLLEAVPSRKHENAKKLNGRSIIESPLKSVDPNSPTPAGMVKVTLNIPNDEEYPGCAGKGLWCDGTGYQMLLDATATQHGQLIPSSGAQSIGNCSAPATLYDVFSHKIPENADPVCTTTNVLVNGSITVHIPAGTYDYAIVNVNPNSSGAFGRGFNIAYMNGRGNDYVFKEGKKYTFTLTWGEWWGDPDEVDWVNTKIEDDISSYPNAPTALTVKHASGNTWNVSWTNPSTDNSGNPLTGSSALTAVKVYRNGTLVYTDNSPVAGGAGSCTANILTPGAHTFTVTAENVGGVSTPATYSVSTCTELISIFPYFENFSSSTFPPACWSTFNASGSTAWSWYDFDGYQINYGYGCARLDQGTPGVVTKALLVMPPMVIPNYGNPKLDFYSHVQYYASYNGITNYSAVLVSTTKNNDINSFTEVRRIQTSEATANWTNISVPLNDYLGDTIYIAFLFNGTDAHRWTIDNVTVSHQESYRDIQALQLTPATGEYAILPNNQQISVRLKNNSASPASGFNMQLLHNGNLIANEAFTGSIPASGDTSYTFNTKLDLSSSGTHKVQAVAILADDQAPKNDTATSLLTHLAGCAPVTVFPFKEGFENGNGSMPSCWTQEYVGGDDNYNWKFLNPTTANIYGGLEPRDAFEGNYQAVFYTTGHSDAVTKLISPPLNLSSLTNPGLKFQHIQKIHGSDYDSLKVYYKTSSSGEWKFIDKFTAVVLEWTERSFPLPEPSAEYYIAFEGYANWGAGTHIDNIYVGEFAAKDVMVKDVNPKGTHLGLSDLQTIKATVKNNGRNPAAGIKLSLFIDGNFIAKETLGNSIPGLGEYEYEFNAKANLSISREYEVTVVSEFPGDEVADNDTLTVIARNLVCDAMTLPYREGFEDDVFPPHCWTTTGSAGGVNWKRLTYDVHSGIGRAFAIWFETDNAWLISPRFSIPNAGEFMLEFWSDMYEATRYTSAEVWISTTTTATSAFTKVYELAPDQRLDNEWVRVEVPLKDYAGQNIYIAFRYKDNSGDYGYGWSIDDVRIFNLSNHIDAELAEITAPVSNGMNMTGTEPVSVKIKNNGGDAISGLQLILERDGNHVATETFTGSIASLETATHTFNNTLDFSAADTSTLKVTVVLEDDMDPSNNYKSKTIINRVCPTITGFPWAGEFWGNYQGTIAPCWTNINVDGDVWEWKTAQTPAGTIYAYSQSYDDEYEYAISPDNWLITPQITTNQPYHFSFKAGGAIIKGLEKFSVLVSTTGINPADFTEVYTDTLTPEDFSETLSSMPGFGFKNIHISLADYIGQPIYIAIRHHDCYDQNKLIVYDVKIWEFSGYTDGAVAGILSPTSGPLSGTEEVKVRLRNNGGKTIKNFPITLNVNGTSTINETVTDSIASMAYIDYVFHQKIDMSDASRSHTVTVGINIEGDAVAGNNSKSVTVANFPSEDLELRGYLSFDESWNETGMTPRAFARFNTANPQDITSIEPYLFGDRSISAGEYAKGSLYFYTVDLRQGTTLNFTKLNEQSFTQQAENATEYYMLDMAYDPTTGSMYGLQYATASASRLVTIDMSNGNPTAVGNMGRTMFTLACNSTGQLYGIDATGNLCTINKTSGAVTVIGNTGYTPEFMQSMAFDHKTDRLFWAMQNERGDGRLLEIHLGSALCYDHGMLGNNAAILMLYAAPEGTSISDLTVGNATPLKAWVEDSKIYVGGLIAGERWSVYDVTGRLLHSGIAKSPIMSIKPGIRGLYIIQSGNRVVKVVY